MDCEHYEEDEEPDGPCLMCRLENPERQPTRVFKIRYWLPSVLFEFLEDSIGSFSDLFAKVSRHIDAMGQEDMENADAQKIKDSITWLGETDARD